MNLYIDEMTGDILRDMTPIKVVDFYDCEIWNSSFTQSVDIQESSMRNTRDFVAENGGVTFLVDRCGKLLEVL